MLEQLINVAADESGWRVNQGPDTLFRADEYAEAMAFATRLAEQSPDAVAVVVEDERGEVESQQYVGHDALPWGDRSLAVEAEPTSAEPVQPDPLESILEHAMPVKPSEMDPA